MKRSTHNTHVQRGKRNKKKKTTHTHTPTWRIFEIYKTTTQAIFAKHTADYYYYYLNDICKCSPFKPLFFFLLLLLYYSLFVIFFSWCIWLVVCSQWSPFWSKTMRIIDGMIYSLMSSKLLNFVHFTNKRIIVVINLIYIRTISNENGVVWKINKKKNNN